MSPSNPEFPHGAIHDLKFKLQSNRDVAVTSELYPYGRVTVEEAKAQNRVRHEAAVTLVIAPINGRLNVLFIKRNNVGIHGGQIALPGGRKENGESFENTAIRELQEETGVIVATENMVCELQQVFIVPSQFVVQPFAAMLHYPPEITPNLQEIESAFWVDLDDIINATSYPCRVTPFGSTNEMEVKAFVLNNQIIWGATAIILEDFRNRIRTK